MNKALIKPKFAYANVTLPLGQNLQGSGSGSGSSAGSGSGSGSGAQKTIPGFECWIDSVNDNEGTNEIKVLQPGTWKFVTEKMNVYKRFPSLKACNKGAGDVTFVLRGDPDADTIRDRVKAHEGEHAKDNEKLFGDLVGGWDKEITTAQQNTTKAKAPTKNVCDKVIYAQVTKSTSPEDLVKNLSQQINKKGDDFHKTAAGKKPTIKPDKPDSDCNNVKARVSY
jgi:hypothetical protein